MLAPLRLGRAVPTGSTSGEAALESSPLRRRISRSDALQSAGEATPGHARPKGSLAGNATATEHFSAALGSSAAIAPRSVSSATTMDVARAKRSRTSSADADATAGDAASTKSVTAA